MDPLERVIRPIVEGQIRSFLHDHPEVLEGWSGKHSQKTRLEAVKDSLAKRVVRDLLCSETRVRLRAAALAATTGAEAEGDDCHC